MTMKAVPMFTVYATPEDFSTGITLVSRNPEKPEEMEMAHVTEPRIFVPLIDGLISMLAATARSGRLVKGINPAHKIEGFTKEAAAA